MLADVASESLSHLVEIRLLTIVDVHVPAAQRATALGLVLEDARTLLAGAELVQQPVVCDFALEEVLDPALLLGHRVGTSLLVLIPILIRVPDCLREHVLQCQSAVCVWNSASSALRVICAHAEQRVDSADRVIGAGSLPMLVGFLAEGFCGVSPLGLGIAADEHAAGEQDEEQAEAAQQ